MQETSEHNNRVANLTFASVYPHYVKKVLGKGRTELELHEIIHWLTGFDATELAGLIEENVTFADFFDRAKQNPKAVLIKGTICGYKIGEIENPLTKQVRYLDKVVDELAKGKSLEKIKRQ